MKKLLALAAFAALAGCATTSTTIQEPERSQYYFYCVGNGILATTCQCMEAKAVSETGTTTIQGLSEDDPKVVAFLDAINGAFEACDAETEKLIKEQKK